jgi:hypothetical protein
MYALRRPESPWKPPVARIVACAWTVAVRPSAPRTTALVTELSDGGIARDPSAGAFDNGDLEIQQRMNVYRVPDTNRHDARDSISDRETHPPYRLDGRRVVLHDGPTKIRVAKRHAPTQRLEVRHGPERPHRERRRAAGTRSFLDHHYPRAVLRGDRRGSQPHHATAHDEHVDPLG